jgi:hypothetical protein
VTERRDEREPVRKHHGVEHRVLALIVVPPAGLTTIEPPEGHASEVDVRGGATSGARHLEGLAEVERSARAKAGCVVLIADRTQRHLST